MMTVEEIQRSALELTDSERAQLAGELLSSLPAVLSDLDEGVAEAQKRSDELDKDPSSGCSWEEIKSSLGR